MRKSILVIAFMMTAGLSGFAEKGQEVNPVVTESFNKDFVSAKEVSWEKQKDYDKATFYMNDLVMYAYYKEDGELLAVVRNMLSTQLPINLMSDLKKNYSGYWITNLFEMAAENKTSYFMTLENTEGTLILESDGSSQWSVYDKSKKTII